MSRKLFPVLCKDFLPCPLYTHRFLILCCQRKQYCDFVVMASVLTADNGICPAVHNFFCPRKIFFFSRSAPLENTASTAGNNSKIYLPCVRGSPQLQHFQNAWKHRRAERPQNRPAARRSRRPLTAVDFHINTKETAGFRGQ